MRRLRLAGPSRARGRDRQQGQIVVIFALMLVVLMGFAALVVDVGVLRRANQELWSALDAGALAGASQLPANGANASTLALQFAQKNYPGLPTADVNVLLPLPRRRSRQQRRPRRRATSRSVCDPGDNVAGLWVCSATASAPRRASRPRATTATRSSSPRRPPCRSGSGRGRRQRRAGPRSSSRRPAGDRAAPRPTCHSTSWSSSTGPAA